MSVVNDVALVCTIASPLLLEVAKISLDKASFPQRNAETNIQKRIGGTLFSDTFYPKLYCYFKIDLGSGMYKFTGRLVLILTMCLLSPSVSFVSLAKTSRVHRSVRHPIVERECEQAPLLVFSLGLRKN